MMELGTVTFAAHCTYIFFNVTVGIFILSTDFFIFKDVLTIYFTISVLPLFHKEISILLHIHKKNTAFRQNSEKIRKFDKNSIRKQIRFGKRFDSIRISNRNQRFDSIRFEGRTTRFAHPYNGAIFVIDVASFNEVFKDGDGSRTNLWIFLKILSTNTVRPTYRDSEPRNMWNLKFGRRHPPQQATIHTG